MLAILNSLNAHNLPIFQPILMILVSKFMVHRALSDKTYLLIGLLSPLSSICRIFAVNGITSTSWCAFQKCCQTFASHRHVFHLASIANKLNASGIAGKRFQTTSSLYVPSCQPIVSVGSFSIFIIGRPA